MKLTSVAKATIYKYHLCLEVANKRRLCKSGHCKKQAYANWAERMEASDKELALESEMDWKIPKSNKRKGRESPTQPTKVAKADAIAARPSLQPRR
ncbi:hypothetical protein LAZ67_5002734 [Cordylochernes scorpioides]|uniref:Uncharacterized protein n=1 Tax=Cordylochernes scorpioides TaxID=51811 RepID=A0ABY6KGL6_9ARAC|nr:hypothetical protein LAZ67_5002734 [Cordylochernes scorpioides]